MRWLAGVAVLLSVLVLAAPAGAKAPAEARCGPSGARTVLITENVRVAYKADLDRNVERVYGCWQGGRTQIVYDESCDDDAGCGGGPELWVAGRYVAYANFDCLRAQACGTVVGVRDLVARQGRKHLGLPRLQALDIGADGTLVWTRGADTTFDERKPPWRVEALRPSGEVVRLDESPDVDPASLAVGRTAAYWTRAGSPQVGSIAPAGGGPPPQTHVITWHAAEAAPNRRPVRRQCGPRNARTRFLSDDVRVTYKDYDDEDERVWGCWRGRKAQLLYSGTCNSDIGCSGGPTLEAQGRYVVYLTFDCTRGAGCGGELGLWDLARRRAAKSSAGHVGELGLTLNGTLVWTAAADDSYGGAVEPYSVSSLAVAGSQARLDSGDPYSLAVGDHRAYWTHGGQTYSAEVP